MVVIVIATAGGYLCPACGGAWEFRAALWRPGMREALETHMWECHNCASVFKVNLCEFPATWVLETVPWTT